MMELITTANGLPTVLYLATHMAMTVFIVVVLIIIMSKLFTVKSGFANSGLAETPLNLPFASTSGQECLGGSTGRLDTRGFFGANEAPVFYDMGSVSQTNKMLTSLQNGYTAADNADYSGFANSANTHLLGTAGFRPVGGFTDDALMHNSQ